MCDLREMKSNGTAMIFDLAIAWRVRSGGEGGGGREGGNAFEGISSRSLYRTPLCSMIVSSTGVFLGAGG